jgi:hypothetical protein
VDSSLASFLYFRNSWAIASNANKLPHTQPLTSDYHFLRIYSSVHTIPSMALSAPSGSWSPSEDASVLLSSARLLHPRIPKVCGVYLRTTSSHLALDFPTGLVWWNIPLRTILGILSSSFLTIWPAHLNSSFSNVRNSTCSTKQGRSPPYLEGSTRNKMYLAVPLPTCLFRSR